MTSLSVIIPTRDRIQDLINTIDTIFSQSTLPNEIIIVDDSNDNVIKQLIESKNKAFSDRKIELRYYRNDKGKSLTKARNFGIDKAQGDIIVFFDDDVLLDRNYLKEILWVYDHYPDVGGVQGYLRNFLMTPSIVSYILRTTFLFHHARKNTCKVLPSTNIIYPSELDQIISCEYLIGSNQSYKRDVLKNFRFDEQMMRYSTKEDLDLSYRINARMPGTLYINPHATLIHRESIEGRMSDETAIMMEYIHSFYLFYKNFNNGLKERIAFFWSWTAYSVIFFPLVMMKLNRGYLKKKKFKGLFMG